MRLPPGARPDITFALRARLRTVVSASSIPRRPPNAWLWACRRTPPHPPLVFRFFAVGSRGGAVELPYPAAHQVCHVFSRTPDPAGSRVTAVPQPPSRRRARAPQAAVEAIAARLLVSVEPARWRPPTASRGGHRPVAEASDAPRGRHQPWLPSDKSCDSPLGASLRFEPILEVDEPPSHTSARISSHDRYPREHRRVTGLRRRKVRVEPTSCGRKRASRSEGEERQCKGARRDRDGFWDDARGRDARDEGAVRHHEERSSGRQGGGDASGQAPGAAHPGQRACPVRDRCPSPTHSWISTRPVFTLKLTPRVPPPPPHQGPTDTLRAKHAMLANTYGIAMPAKMDIECQILSKCVPQPSGPWPRSRPPRPANDQKVCAVFPPAPFRPAP